MDAEFLEFGDRLKQIAGTRTPVAGGAGQNSGDVFGRQFAGVGDPLGTGGKRKRAQLAPIRIDREPTRGGGPPPDAYFAAHPPSPPGGRVFVPRPIGGTGTSAPPVQGPPQPG